MKESKNLIAKYNNQLNKELRINNLNERDLNIFLLLIAHINESIENKTTLFDIELFRSLINKNRNTSINELKEQFKNTFENLNKTKLKNETKNDLTVINIFQYYGIRKNEKGNYEFYYQLTNLFKRIFTTLNKNFTKIHIIDFLKIKGIYAKRTFEYLSHFNEPLNEQKRTLQDWRYWLGIPTTYKDYNLKIQIFKPIIKELKKTDTFKDIELITYKKNKKIVALGFKWTKQKIKIKLENHLKDIDNYEEKLLNNIELQYKNNMLSQKEYLNKKIDTKLFVEKIKDNNTYKEYIHLRYLYLDDESKQDKEIHSIYKTLNYKKAREYFIKEHKNLKNLRFAHSDRITFKYAQFFANKYNIEIKEI